MRRLAERLVNVPTCLRRTVLAWPLFASLLLAQDPAKPSLQGTRPNILFVLSDDHAAHAISAYGSKLNRTPNIDRLAADGVLFRNNFCGNALCGPSRATILTGLHSHANGFMRNGNLFDGAQRTFPQLLQQAGYTTAIFGKWHLESEPQGFDTWAVLPGQGHYYNPDFETATGRVRKDGHVTDLTTSMAIEWLEHGRDADKPFVLMCQHKAPHREWMPAPQDLALYRDTTLPEPETLFDDYRDRIGAAAATEMQIDRDLYLHSDLMVEPTEAERTRARGKDTWWDPMMTRLSDAQRTTFLAAFAAENAAFRRDPPKDQALVRWKLQRYLKNYLRCVAGVDRSVGQLLDWLDAHPVVKANTIVIYSSDQGFFLGDHGYYDKRWMYEESLRMPLLLSWPGHVNGPREVTQLTQNIDFAPTFLDLAGAPVPESMHGKSLVPLLQGEQPADWRTAIYYHYYESKATHQVPAHFGVRTSRHKLIRYYEPEVDGVELFDLEKDPNELHSVADNPDYGELRLQLERQLQALRTQYDDTTGDLASGAFPRTAGITRILPIDGGYRVFANATAGFALQSPPSDTVTAVTVTLRPLAGRQQQNGYVVLDGATELGAGEDGGTARIRAGIAFGRRRLQLLGAEGMRELAGAAIEWDGSSPVTSAITVSETKERIAVVAQGVRIEAALPSPWRGLAAWGYGASNAETEFTAAILR